MRYLTRGETCDLLRISPTTLWRLVRDGELTPVKIGRRVIYAEDDLQTFTERHRQQVAIG